MIMHIYAAKYKHKNEENLRLKSQLRLIKCGMKSDERLCGTTKNPVQMEDEQDLKKYMIFVELC